MQRISFVGQRNHMLTKLLAIYSSVLTTLLTGLVLAGSVAAKMQSFDEIEVRRINVREPDGTLGW